MSLITESDLRTYSAAVKSQISESIRARITGECEGITNFDVFLSHAFSDWELVYGFYALLRNQGLKVYVDHICDRQLDRTIITPKTASVLRARLDSCASLIYAYSEGATKSRWMQWEIGYFDGKFGKVAVAPIVVTGESDFDNVGFVSLYPVIDKTGSKTFWVNSQKNGSPMKLTDWIHDSQRRLLFS